MMPLVVTAIVAATLVPVTLAADPTPFSLACFHPDRRTSQLAYESALNVGVDPAQLRAHHEMLGDEPHIAGTEGDLKVIKELEDYFRGLGLQVETQWLKVYLSRPISAELSIVEAPAAGDAKAITAESPMLLGTTEPPVDGDPYSRDSRLTLAWNAYSGSGDVTAEVVYANFGTIDDFKTLADAGVSVKDKIVLARYGGNFRGYKAKFAQEAGAAGLVIFTDPAEALQGPSYPQGGWATPTQVQRGSILTLDAPGDPLTPGFAATEDIPDSTRLDPEKINFPKIPVQPVGWDAAQRILERMSGKSVADVQGCEKWAGGLKLTYRVEGGSGLKVRLNVKQDRGLVRTANVVATLQGTSSPFEKVIVGCHHDAWGFGASDPLAGLMLVLESARVFAEQAKLGNRPERTIQFAAWGAEEFGIIGSTEWVEGHTQDLELNGIAYLNLDMATMGDRFWAASSPTLKTLIADATKTVPHCRKAEDGTEQTVYQEWMSRGGTREKPILEPDIGSMGGGSDHVGFLCNAAVPSMAIGTHGARGTSYHSNYDTLSWYHAVVGDDYLPAQMNTRVVNVLLARLARADIPPMDVSRYARDLDVHLAALEARAKDRQVTVDFAALRASADRFRAPAELVVKRITESQTKEQFEAMKWLPLTTRRIERNLLVVQGLPGRPFYRSLWASPDADSGYSAWMLPGIAAAIEKHDDKAIRRAVAMCTEAFNNLTVAIGRAGAVVEERWPK